MSRGSDKRENKQYAMSVLKSVRGHESSVAHSFNHTDGHCPKCGSEQQHMFFCVPGGEDLPALNLCELDGEHLHRLCAQCGYPWIERPLDQAILAEVEGEVQVESELAAALACVVERGDGLTLDMQLVSSRRYWMLHFKRDAERKQVVITVSPPQKQSGKPAHPSREEVQA